MDHVKEIENKVQKLLDNKSLSAAKISRDTGVGTTTVKELRRKERDLNILNFNYVKKLYNYQLELEEAEEENDNQHETLNVYKHLNEK